MTTAVMATATPSAATSTPVDASANQLGTNPSGMNMIALPSRKNRVAPSSPLIIPNDAPQTCHVDAGVVEICDGIYGVQWGTIWDTIDYTVTGAFGNWIDSPFGLNGDGIDNEMSLSHLSNCGTGSCWSPDVEQLHVDGNKSLIYAMINYSLKPENRKFKTKGRVGYIHNRGVIKEKSDPTTTPPKRSSC